MSLLVRAAIAVYFRRLRVLHRERLLARGPMLLLANHPAMWTDVLVLDVAVRRKLHFIAEGRLFRPLARAAILQVHGALPVIHGGAGRDARSRNRETFRRCHELFRRGEVVALFPEGVSAADRTVLRLKTGAARLGLESAEAGLADATPLVLPVGIHYTNRTSFGSEVTVSIGEPIDLGPFRAIQRRNPEAAVHALTEHIHRALRSLILDVPEPELASAVADLERLMTPRSGAGALEMERAQKLGAWLATLRVGAPERFSRIQRHARAYRRARCALGISDEAILGEHALPRPRRGTWTLVTLCLLGAPAAAIGAALHALPWAAGELIAHRVRRDPARFSFGRIASGLVFFPLAYATLLLAAVRGPYALRPPWAFGLLAATAILGMFTLRYAGWGTELRERLRLIILERGHSRLVRRARAEQRLLMRLLAGTRLEDPAGRRPAKT